jgi:RNA polymerase sigma-70 factor (ECF subfamily)
MSTNAVSIAAAPEAPGEARAASSLLSPVDEAMARLADGDRRALREVHDAVRLPMIEAARRVLGPGPDAEDAAQNALHKLFAQASDYDRRRRVLPWAVALVVFEARTIRKQHQRRRIDALDTGRFAAIASGSAAPEELLGEAEVARVVEGLVGALSEADRATVRDVLAENEEGRGPAFRKRKQRALERLREAWRTIHGRD